MMVLLYVDDIILTGSCSELLKMFVTQVSNEFSMKNLGILHYFLGIQAVFHDSCLFLHQAKFTKEILLAAGMESCNPMPIPLPLQPDTVSNGSTLFSDPTYFRSLAGKLQYLTLTRPDILFAVNFVCQRMHAPTVGDFALLNRIIRYLRGTSSMV